MSGPYILLSLLMATVIVIVKHQSINQSSLSVYISHLILQGMIDNQNNYFYKIIYDYPSSTSVVCIECILFFSWQVWNGFIQDSSWHWKRSTNINKNIMCFKLKSILETKVS